MFWLYTNIAVFTTLCFEKIMEIYFITTSYYVQIYFIITSYMKYIWLWWRIVDTEFNEYSNVYIYNALASGFPCVWSYTFYIKYVHIVHVPVPCVIVSFICRNKIIG